MAYRKFTKKLNTRESGEQREQQRPREQREQEKGEWKTVTTELRKHREQR